MALTAKQSIAIAALLSTTTKKAAAKQAGISEVTLNKYFHDPEFVEAYEKAAGGLIGEATKLLQQGMKVAVVRLIQVAKDPKTNAAVAVNAARSLLEYGLRYTEFTEILSELHDVEDDICITTDYDGK